MKSHRLYVLISQAKYLLYLPVFVLAWCDYRTMLGMFSIPLGDIAITDRIVYAFAACVCLEALPTFWGHAAARFWDKTAYSANQRLLSAVAMGFSGVGSVLLWGFVAAMRTLLIRSRGGVAAFLNGSYQDGFYLIDLFLTVLPIFTSILAMVCGFMGYCPAGDRMESQADHDQSLALEARKQYDEALSRMKNSAARLWAKVSREEIPDRSLVEFQNQVLARIRNKSIQNAQSALPLLLRHYNASCEAILQDALHKMAARSNIPQDILSLNLAELLRTETPGESPLLHWEPTTAEPELQQYLKTTLDNRIVIHQSAVGFPGQES